MKIAMKQIDDKVFGRCHFMGFPKHCGFGIDKNERK
ncbi:hypothetical protein SpiGrapes_0280 [Sphaerochaeta pleomorpha str. Grapes]|uniref:Uncharacterized protein n=1 Tax=Sphaerochaeta pleomorpha (strain ATCC BAA-1885 / DSM 22778 / Grapes) TaxID=158190 RepID=G8QUW4_SPHPG|nr:hypothetical protein SpiGrapes_0280 [Sphaerochaeta pleomorpha str. Grapes]